MNSTLFSFDKYKEKINSVTYLRLISFEIYKLILFYLIIYIISSLSHYFPFSFFYELEFNFYLLTKIFIYLIIVDLCYFVLFKSNIGQFSFLEIIISLVKKPNIMKILSISISFCVLFLVTNELKSLMPRLDPSYVKEKYNIEPTYRDEYEENYYLQKRLTKSTIYEYADNILIICASIIYVLHFIILKQDFWTKINLTRISNLKNKIWLAITNIKIIGLPLFFIIYIFLIFFYHTLFIFDLSLNYTSLFMIEYNLLYITKECLNNFICAKINYICYEINSKEQLIKKEIDFRNDDNFYIIHHLNNLNDIYKYPHDVKLNTELLKFDNLDMIKKKVYFFIESLNRKYSMFLSKKKFFIINYNNNMNGLDNIKIMIRKFLEYFDFGVNEIFENETCISNIKLIIEIIGNVIIFIADAKINKSNEEKYMEYSDNIYFFVERLFDIDKLLVITIQNNRNIETSRNELINLTLVIRKYFDLIRNRQNKYKFIKLETQNIQNILYQNI